MEPTAMQLLLTDFQSVATSIVGMAVKLVDFIILYPILLIPVAIGFLGAGIGLVKTFKG